ncbi:hypothetical protein LTR81_028030, partial [Elasticomyces elasticus]
MSFPESIQEWRADFCEGRQNYRGLRNVTKRLKRLHSAEAKNQIGLDGRVFHGIVIRTLSFRIMNTNERLLPTPDRTLAPERDRMRWDATCQDATFRKRGPDPAEVTSQPATKRQAIRELKASLPRLLANAILLGGGAFQKDRSSQMQWSSDLEKLKPNGKAMTVDQLFEAHGIYSRTSGLRSRQSSLVKYFLAVGSAKMACGEKTRRRFVLIGRLIIGLINLASLKYGKKAYSICVALTAAPEEEFSFGMEAMRSCSLIDVEHVVSKVCSVLEHHPDAAWQNIDRKFAFDPARMISAIDLSYGNTSPCEAESSNEFQ